MGKNMKDMNTTKRWLIIVCGVAIAILTLTVETMAQSNEGYLYAKVHTSRTVYTGPIRWGAEEVLWSDVFNAAKSDDHFETMVDKDDQSLLDYDWNFRSIWSDNPAHQFNIQFGNIKTLTPLSKGRARITLKNDAEIVLRGEGYNDLESRIQIIDEELGVVGIDWEKIEKIEFLPTPKKLNLIFGKPLFGTVETARREKFTGYIVWDNDERVGNDKLDGDSEDGKMSLKFDDVASIQRSGGGCDVKLKSGREFYMDGSNDVDEGNRGVLVINPEIGIIKVSWKAFRNVTFTEPGFAIQSFDAFDKPAMLKGTVSRLDGNDLSGQIVFDLDETINFELIEGIENDIEYQVPLKNIRRITPKNSDFSSVELVSGKTLLLGDMRDVSSDNGGILVFEKGDKKPQYIRWRQVNEVVFK